MEDSLIKSFAARKESVAAKGVTCLRIRKRCWMN